MTIDPPVVVLAVIAVVALLGLWIVKKWLKMFVLLVAVGAAAAAVGVGVWSGS